MVMMILNDSREPVPCDDPIEWARWMLEIGNRRVAYDELPQGTVSTVFLGVETLGGPFETMVFTGEQGEVAFRYRHLGRSRSRPRRDGASHQRTSPAGRLTTKRCRGAKMECPMKAKDREPTAGELAAAQDPDALLPVWVVAHLVGVSAFTVRMWESRGAFPKAVHVNPKIKRWRASDVRAWLHAQGDQAANSSGSATTATEAAGSALA